MIDIYNTIAEAEAVLRAAGYTRDQARALWVNGNAQAKVISADEPGKFKIWQR